jgi:hypothetical protein
MSTTATPGGKRKSAEPDPATIHLYRALAMSALATGYAAALIEASKADSHKAMRSIRRIADELTEEMLRNSGSTA